MIDFSPLNEFIQQTPYRMKTATFVLKSVSKDDFMASLELKDV